MESALGDLVVLWDAGTGQQRLSVHMPPQPLAFFVQFAPGGATLIGWNNQSVKLSDTATALERPAPKEPPDLSAAAAFTAVA